VTFDLGPVTFHPEIAFRSVFPENECRFYIGIGICRDDVFGDKGMSCGGIVVM
jgi:hypothetical protein